MRCSNSIFFHNSVPGSGVRLRFQRKISQRLDLSRGQTLARLQQQEAEADLVAVGP